MAFDWDDLDTDVNPALVRLEDYNSGAYNASTNPHGFGAGGHISQFPAATDDVATVGNALPAFADLMSCYADAADASATAAAGSAAALTATSTTSVALNIASGVEKTFTTQSGKSFSAGETLIITSDANPTTHFMYLLVTSYSSTTLIGDILSFAGSGSRSDWTVRHAAAPGRAAGLSFIWSTDTNNSDPTTGKIKINHGTPSSATALYISETSRDGIAISTILARWGASTSTIKGTLVVAEPTSPANFLSFEITSVRTDNGTWDTFTIQNGAGTAPADGAIVHLFFAPTGDKGTTGDTGATGSTGSTGAAGSDAGLEFLFNSATSGDPGSGKFLFNNATFGSATAFHVSETDNNSLAIGAFLAAIDNGSGTNKILVVAIKQGGGAFFSFHVTAALSDQGSYDTFAITPIATSGSVSNNDEFHFLFVPLEKGDTGSTGATGDAGPAGPTTAPTWVFDNSTSDGDPGANEFRLNHGTIASVSKAFISDEGLGAADMTTFLLALDDSTNTDHRGSLFIVQADDPTKWALFTIGAATDDGDYIDLGLTYVVGPGGFVNGETCAFAFYRTGNKGTDGEGAGTITHSGSVTEDDLALWGADNTQIKSGGAKGALANKNTIDSASLLDANVVTLAKLATQAAGTVLANNTGGAAVPTALAYSDLKTAMMFVKGDVGLGNVDNTSDANKPVSTAAQTLFDLKRIVRVRAATTGNVTIATALNNGDSLDGLTLATGELVLVGAQTSPAENGVYVVGVSPARHTDLDAFADYPGLLVTVQEGTANADTVWLCTSNAGGTIDSSALTFVQQGGPSTTIGRTILAAADAAAVKTALSLNNVDNTSDATKNAASVTLENKTLTAPKFANNGFIADANGNESVVFGTTASAVNEIKVTNAATGANPQISAQGGDTDVGLNFAVKAAGKYNFTATASGPAELRLFEDSDNGSNYAAIIATASMSGNRTLTLPDQSGTVAVTADFVGKQGFFVPASSCVARTTNGAASFSTELATNDVMIAGFDFDTSTAEAVQFFIALPKQWNESTVTFRAYWTAASGSGGVAWSLAGRSNSDDDAMDQAFGTAVVVTDTLITANDVHVTAESSAVTIAGTPAEGDLQFFEIARAPSNGSDTLGVDARLLGVEIFVTTNAGTDA